MRLVLEAVRLEGLDTRPRIAAGTGLSRAVVGQRVQQLIAGGLLAESETGVSTGGRPPRALRIPRSAGHVLAVDLGATGVEVAAVTLTGTIIQQQAATADVGDGPEATLSRVEELLDALVAGLGPGDGPVRALGIGLPGPVQFETGRPVWPPIMPGWHDYPVRERLEDRFGVPVWVDNDVNIMAMGEWRAGAARGVDDVVWVKIGSGIGAGLITGGAIHRGAQGAAGDVGHIQVVEDGVICRCGNAGCLEALAGGAAIGRDAQVAAHAGRSAFLAECLAAHTEISARTVAIGAQRGDAVCVELLQRSGRLVGHMLATVVNLFNPSLVVLGGSVAHSGALYLATIRESVYRRSLPLATGQLGIVTTALGDRAGVTGAAAMATDELLSQDWIRRLLLDRIQ